MGSLLEGALSRLAAGDALRRSLPLRRPLPEPLSPRATGQVPRIGARPGLDADQPDRAHVRLLAALLDPGAGGPGPALPALHPHGTDDLDLLPVRGPDVVLEPARARQPRQAGAL